MDAKRSIAIDRATIGDLPRLENVFSELLDEIEPMGHLDRVEARRQFVSALTSGVAHVLWCGDIPAGFDAWELVEPVPHANPALPAVAAEVATWIHPSWRRERNATQLRQHNLREIAERWRGRKYLVLTSTNPRNAPMCGFLRAQGAEPGALLLSEIPQPN